MNSTTILYISYDGMTDPLGQSQVIPYLIGLSNKGHNIAITSSEKKENFNTHKDSVGKLLQLHNIQWYPVEYSDTTGIIAKRKNLSRLKQKAKQLCAENNIKLVHCRSYMAALIGLYLKKKYGIKFIFDMRGFWADERVDGNLWQLNNFIHKRIYTYFKKKELTFLLKADYTVSLTQNAKNEILSWAQIKNKQLPIEVIPCCVDLALFNDKQTDSAQQETLKKQLQLSSSDFVLCYLGSIGTWYMPDEMLDFYKVLLSKKSNAKFLFITADNKQIILDKARSKNIPANNIIVKKAGRKEVPLYLSLADLAIYFIKPCYSKKASSPTKTGEIMAMGIPIITNAGIGDSDTIINESHAGFIVNNFTPDDYQHIIDKIDVILNTDKTIIKNTAQKYFSLERGVEKYNSIYKKLCS